MTVNLPIRTKLMQKHIYIMTNTHPNEVTLSIYKSELYIYLFNCKELYFGQPFYAQDEITLQLNVHKYHLDAL